MLYARTAFQACGRELYLELQHIPTIKVNSISSLAFPIISLLFPALKKPLGSLEGACPERKHGPPPRSRGRNAMLCSGVAGPTAEWIKLGSRNHRSKTHISTCFPSLSLTCCGVVQLWWPGCIQATAQCCRELIISSKCNTSLTPAAGEPRPAPISHTATVFAVHGHCTKAKGWEQSALETFANSCCLQTLPEMPWSAQRDTFPLQ